MAGLSSLISPLRVPLMTTRPTAFSPLSEQQPVEIRPTAMEVAWPVMAGLGVRETLKFLRKGPDSKPNYTKYLTCMRAWCTLNLTLWVKSPSPGVVVQRRVPAQTLSSSSSYLGSKLRGPLQNIPGVTSKQDVNLNKQN
ncbi:hypothetical protein AVEN_187273-1 [Araneus ventricosus]|uniref:Uncharacterized protein n=1 Tax=Araneus ventricosus TaxID=182803 RepID=A0A4Y2KC43_ARAVE|nr:hypothetical protein AVEN_187273-1 [Araneus ventricosus]